jgi:hypothetical protein
VAVIAMSVVITACTSSPPGSGAAASGPAATSVSGVSGVSGAFGARVFITSLWSDPWVAVGWTAATDGRPDTACFLSADGRRWTACGVVPVDSDGFHTRLLGVARVGSTLIAGGAAVGALHGNLRPYMFAGPLGGPLRELNLPRELFGGENIISFEGLTAGPLGGLAAGTYVGVTNQSVAQVWRTSNGTDWQRLDAVAALTGSPQEILAGRAVAVGPHRAVLVGTAIDLRHLENRDDGAAWWSDDGASWVRADLRGAGMGGPGDQELRAVAAIDGGPRSGGFLAGGSDGTSAVVWSSPDGRQWQRSLPLPGGRGRAATVTALAGSGAAGLWAAGVVDGTPRLWRSADGSQWKRLSLPAPPVAGVVASGPAQSVSMGAANGQLVVVVQGAAGSYEVNVSGTALGLH